MLDRLQPVPPDPLLGLMSLFNADNREDKIDLGVGVYRDEHGATPVMDAVKIAERLLCEQQATKAYVGARGDTVFLQLLQGIVLGSGFGFDRVASVQTPGATGALRLGADLLARAGAREVVLGRPCWANHPPVFTSAGHRLLDYAYFDPYRQRVDDAALMDALSHAPKGAVVLLQASCHNPTGADLSVEAWAAAGEIIARRQLIPFVDVAYQGFGLGIEEDVAGLRGLLSQVPEALVAVSCSKSFGLYRERTGALFVVTERRGEAESNMLAVARANYSMPPDHGAATVRTILDSAALSSAWRQELAANRTRVRCMREALARAGHNLGLDLSALAAQNGMFSQLALSEAQIGVLRATHGIYVAPGGRINVAGLRGHEVPRLVTALRDIGLGARL